MWSSRRDSHPPIATVREEEGGGGVLLEEDLDGDVVAEGARVAVCVLGLVPLQPAQVDRGGLPARAAREALEHLQKCLTRDVDVEEDAVAAEVLGALDGRALRDVERHVGGVVAPLVARDAHLLEDGSRRPEITEVLEF